MSFRIDDISFEDIEEHYWCASLGDLKLIIDNERDTFNATKMCEAQSKNFEEWLEVNQDCKEEISENRSKNEEISGAYANRNLIINIAGWLSPKIRNMVKEIIYCYIIEKKKSRIEKLKQCLENYSGIFKELRKDIFELNRTIKEYKDENKNLKKKIESLSKPLEHEAGDRAVAVSPKGAYIKREDTLDSPFPIKEGEERYYAIIKKEKYPYLIKITKNYDETLTYLKKTYPKFEEIFITNYSSMFRDRKITKTTNTSTMLEVFMNEMKVQYKNRVDINHDGIDLLGEYPECQFLKDIRKDLELNDSPAFFTLVLVRKQAFPYTVTRWKPARYNAELTNFKKTYPNLEVLYRTLDPDATSLHQRIKNYLKNSIEAFNWDIKLKENYSEKVFKDDVFEFVNSLQNNADTLPIYRDE